MRINNITILFNYVDTFAFALLIRAEEERWVENIE